MIKIMKDTELYHKLLEILTKHFKLVSEISDILSIIEEKYSEKHRYFHVWDHILYMYNIAKKLNIDLSDKLILSMCFHDIIYDPKRNDNEERSAELFYSIIPDDEIRIAILETKDHNPKTELGNKLCELDLYGLYDDFDVFYENSYKIFKEYQFADFNTYKKERRKILEKFKVNPDWIDAVDAFKPKIAIFPGSFNPFTLGHLDILEKAEQIFDKVIIARGINSDKKIEIRQLPDYLNYREIINYDNLLCDFVEQSSYDLTIIRGLRNIMDFTYENTTLQYWRDFLPNIKVIYIMSDVSKSHISSSGVRSLEKFIESSIINDMYL